MKTDPTIIMAFGKGLLLGILGTFAICSLLSISAYCAILK